MLGDGHHREKQPPRWKTIGVMEKRSSSPCVRPKRRRSVTEVERAHWRQPFWIAKRRTSLWAERSADDTIALIEAVAAGKRSYVSRGCGKTGQRKWEELWRSISFEESYYACSQRLDMRERSVTGRRKKYLHVCALVLITVFLLPDRADRSWRADRNLVRSSERSRCLKNEEVNYQRTACFLTEPAGREAC